MRVKYSQSQLTTAVVSVLFVSVTYMGVMKHGEHWLLFALVVISDKTDGSMLSHEIREHD